MAVKRAPLGCRGEPRFDLATANMNADALAGAVAAAAGGALPGTRNELETAPQIFAAAPVFIRPGALALLGGEQTDRGRS